MPTIFDTPEFNDLLRTDHYELYPSESVKMTQDNSGNIYRSQSGPRIWHGSISIIKHDFGKLREVESLLLELQEPGKYFNFTPRFHSRPQKFDNPAWSTNINVRGNHQAGNLMRIRGAVNEVVFSRGDRFSLEDAQGCHRLYEITSEVRETAANRELTINIPFSESNAPKDLDAPRFFNPKITCQIVPGSLQGGGFGLDFQEGFKFDFVQAVRVI